MEQHRGGVAFVFTDIEGSTQLVRDLVSSYGLALRIHRRILQTNFEEHGGKQMGSEGDGLYFVFANPDDAVTAAIAAQQKVEHYGWPDGLRLRVRMGIHHGPVRVSGGEYLGLTVHEVSRICAAAHGGQILCSSSVAQALGQAGAGVEFRDLGAYALRGLLDPQHLFQVCVDGLEDDFPPPRDAVRDGGVRVAIWRREPPRRAVPAPTDLVVRDLDGSDLDGSVEVEMGPSSAGLVGAFRLLVRRAGVVEEEFDGLTVGGVSDAAAIVNNYSNLIRIAP